MKNEVRYRGYYWVQLKSRPTEVCPVFAVAFYADQYPGWFLTGDSNLYQDSDFAGIGEIITAPGATIV